MKYDWLPFPLPQVFKVVDPKDFGLSTAGPLELSRGPDLKLQISLCAEGRCALSTGVPGTEWGTTPINVLTKSGQPGILDGFCRSQCSTVTEDDRTQTRIVGQAESLSITLDRREALAIVEWLTNIPHLLWTRSTERTNTVVTARCREGSVAEDRMSDKSLSCDHVELQLELPTLSKIQIGTAPLNSVTEGVPIEQPGFIEYYAGLLGLPDEHLRRTVRRAFEFLFDAGLGVLGHCEVDHACTPLRVCMRSPYTAGGFGGSRRPALLHSSYRDGLDEKVVSRLVRRYVEVESDYDLNRAIWLCLHARNAPLEMAAGYVGAAFEVLRRRFYEHSENEPRSRLFPAPQWTAIAQKLDDAITTLEHFQDCKDLTDKLAHLRNRLPGLNAVSGSRLNELFLTDLGLKFGAIEKVALAARNDAAHANEFAPDEGFEKLQAYRAAHTLFARCLLAILGGQVRYFDYSSRDYPDRDSSEAQGSP